MTTQIQTKSKQPIAGLTQTVTLPTQLHKIKNLQFSLLSPSEIKGISVVHVFNSSIMDNGFPNPNGLLDTRMGSIERNLLCSTCGEGAECPGHYGHIELSRPVYHVGFISKLKKVLESICIYCSVLKHKGESLKECWEKGKIKRKCEGCHTKQPMIRKEGLTLTAIKPNDDGGKIILNGQKVKEALTKIADDDIRRMGFCPTNSRPEWMLLDTLIVVPTCVRPSISMEGFLRAEDDLTHKYSDIIKADNSLRKYEGEGAPAHVLRDYEQLLQFHVATLMDNESAGNPQAMQKSGRPIKAIGSRIKGKEGRFRGNLMGKRVDFSARSVITAEPCIGLEELGVPKEIAMIHTFPEKVTDRNIHHLRQLVENGPAIYPGANYVIRNDGVKVDLRFVQVELEPGYVVERHMVDKDKVLFNRQPSLHKMSMMGHSVRVMDGKSFRLNLSVTSPYNADFDGDEMNLHMPQSESSLAELGDLMMVSRNILSPQSNKPVMGICQDTLVGVYLLTGNNFFTPKVVYKILLVISSISSNSNSITNSSSSSSMGIISNSIDGNSSNSNSSNSSGQKKLYFLISDFSETLHKVRGQ